VDPDTLREATELIEVANARMLEHLQLTRAMSARMRGTDEGRGRTYG
jgi:hypothetical protein